MVLPIKLIIGVNENDVFARFYDTGDYAPAPETHSSPSNSMNVNWPSNIRRLFQLYFGQLIEGKDPSNPKRKIIEKQIRPDLYRMRQEIVGAYSISDQRNRAGLLNFYQQKNIIHSSTGDLISALDPHGGISYEAMLEFREKTSYGGIIVSLLTGHPAKFSEVLYELGIKPQLPMDWAKLVNKPHGRHFEVDSDYNTVKSLIIRLHQQELAKYK